MPITFAPADPFSPAESFAAGANQQQQQEFQNYLMAQRQAHSQQMQEASLAQNYDQMAQQQNQFDARQMPSERDRWASADEQKQMQARANIHAAMRDQEVTQQEVRRKQQVDAAIADVNQKVQAGVLRPEEGEDVIMQMKTGISPIEQRLKMQQTKTQEEKIRFMNEEAKQQAIVQARTNDFLAKNAPGSIFPVPGGFGIVQPGGKIDYHPNPKPEKEETVKPLSEATLMKLQQQAIEMVDGRMVGGQLVGGMLKPGEVWQPGHREGQISAEFDKLKSMLEQHRGGNGTPSTVRTTQLPPGQGNPGQPPAAQQPPGMVGPPAPPPTPQPLPPDRSQWKPEAVRAVGMIERQADDYKKANKPKAATMMQHAMNLYTQTGGPANMTPEQKQTYVNMLREADRLSK